MTAVPCIMEDGRIVDLAALTAADIDFAEIARSLSRVARFNGRCRDASLSVAQHSVMGADALFRETGDGILAGYFLLHDAHEYLLGDLNRPAILHLDGMVGRALSHRGIELEGIFREALTMAREAMDAVVLTAANLPPIDRMPVYRRQVRDMDERMCTAESRALYGDAEIPLVDSTLPPPKLTGALRAWGAMKAEEAFVDRLGRYLGVFVRSVG